MRYVLLIAFLLQAKIAWAEAEKSEAILNAEVLDAYCIQNQDDFENIIYLAESHGGKILPEDQADPAMQNLGGKSVYVPYKGRNYIVAFASGGGCTVVTKNIDQKNLKRYLAKKFAIKKIDTQSSLSQVSEMFEVTANKGFKGSVVSLVYAQPETGYTDGSISFIPAANVQRARK